MFHWILQKHLQDHAMLSSFPVYCTIARMSTFPGQCERLSRRLVNYGFDDVGLTI